MRQEHWAIVTGALMTVGGLALLAIPDFDGAGWYVAAAGLLYAGFGAWFHIRGGNVPYPLFGSAPLPPPAVAAVGCPACGGTSTRPMTGAEATAFYGYDRLVLVRPKVCLGCGQGFEAQPSRVGCHLMIGVAAVGGLVGLAFFAGVPLALWFAVQDGMFNPDMRIK